MKILLLMYLGDDIIGVVGSVGDIIVYLRKYVGITGV